MLDEPASWELASTIETEQLLNWFAPPALAFKLLNVAAAALRVWVVIMCEGEISEGVGRGRREDFVVKVES